MACSDCGNCGHDSSSSSSEDEDFGDSFFDDDDSSSSSGENDFLPFFPTPQMFMPAFHDLLRHFPANPLQFVLEIRRFQAQITRDQSRTKIEEEKNRKRQLSLIAKTSFSNSQDLNEKQCVICLDEFEEGVELKKLSCKHHYHVKCIDKWLVQNERCPLCNSKAVSSLEEVQSKHSEAKRLRENAQKRMRKRPRRDLLKEKRLLEIKKNPANATGRKLKSTKKRKGILPASFLRRRVQNSLDQVPRLFGSFAPPVQSTYGGAIDSDDEEEQIERAILESLQGSEEMDNEEMDNEEMDNEEMDSEEEK